MYTKPETLARNHAFALTKAKHYSQHSRNRSESGFRRSHIVTRADGRWRCVPLPRSLTSVGEQGSEGGGIDAASIDLIARRRGDSLKELVPEDQRTSALGRIERRARKTVCGRTQSVTDGRLRPKPGVHDCPL